TSDPADRDRDRHRTSPGRRGRDAHVHLQHARRDLALELYLARYAAERDYDVACRRASRRRKLARDPRRRSRAAAGRKERDDLAARCGTRVRIEAAVLV